MVGEGSDAPIGLLQEMVVKRMMSFFEVVHFADASERVEEDLEQIEDLAASVIHEHMEEHSILPSHCHDVCVALPQV